MTATENFGQKNLSSMTYTDFKCPSKNTTINKLALNKSAISTSKLKLYRENFYANSKLSSDITYKKTTKFTAKMDIQCVLEGRAQNLFFQTKSLNMYSSSFQNFSLIKDLTYTEFENLLNQSPCILSVGWQKKYHKSTIEFNDPLLPTQHSYLNAIHAQNAYTFMNEPNFPYSHFSKPIIVAVIDSGVDYNHEDLKENIWHNTNNEISGYNAIVDQNSLDFMDYDFHGTHVAGIIAAVSNNNIGISGVSPVNTQIMPVKIITGDGSGGSTAEVADGIKFAVDHGANILNLSFGSSEIGYNIDSIVYDELVAAVNKGVFVVAAIGNINPDDSNYSREVSLDGYHYFPAVYSAILDGFVSVGSIKSIDQKISFFSHYSPEILDIMAPGSYDDDTGIFSTIPKINSKSPNELYTDVRGTSMSTPVVSAAAAILLNVAQLKGITLTPAEIQSYILDSADNKPDLVDYVKNGRSLNLSRLFQMAYKCL